MAEDRAVKFCTQRDYVKSCQTDGNSPLKEAWLAHVTHFRMCNCGHRKISIRHCTLLSEINSAIDSGSLMFMPTTIHASDTIL